MQNKKKITLEEVQKNLQNIVLKHLNKHKTYKVSSGLFQIEDSLSMKEIINEVDSMQIKNTFNEYVAMSSFNTAIIKAKFFNFEKQTIN